MDFGKAFEPVAATTRSGYDESVHFGAVAVLDASGELIGSIGDPELEIYPRSANKPMQADAVLDLGASLTPEQIALACSSHDGTRSHLDVVRSTLASVGLDETSLANTASLPLDPLTAETVVAAGGKRTALAMNCSGKHAAMIAACVYNGWPVEGYLQRDHPLQLAIDAHIAGLAGPVVHVGVDGCGAPAHVLRLDGLARAFGVLAARRGPVQSAMSAHPDLVGGALRPNSRLMREVPTLIAKDGAEGVFAAALPDGIAVAVKIADGASRAAAAVIAAVLAEYGLGVDVESYGEPVLGHGKPVGRVHAVFKGLA